MRVAVIGAGVAGLCGALTAMREHDVVAYEAEDAPGGKMRSQRLDGALFEWGPNGFLSGALELRALIDELQLSSELVEADPAAAKRYVYWNGRLHALPQKPPQALTTALLSPRGKIRALRELFTKPDASARDGESVAAFFTRHFGVEVAERIVAPALLGMSAGDARATSVDAAFPMLRRFERESGSVLKAMARSRPQVRQKLLSFGAAGMQRFAGAAAERLGDRLRLGTPVSRIDRDDASWRIEHSFGSDRADALVLAVPSYAAAPMVAACDPELSTLIGRIAYAPMRVAGMAFRRDDVPTPLDGFGFLAARDQGVRILGALYTSTMFPQQAPPGMAYLRVFMGGALDPSVMDFSQDAARELVARDLRETLGIAAAPVAFHETLWPRAIPQYALDHQALVRAIDARAERHARLLLVGNAYRGLGVGDTAKEAVRRVGSLLAGS
jgi:oxygen-dependent protoporphyrinogen oxidase